MHVGVATDAEPRRACALHMHCTCAALQARQLLVSRDGQIATVGAAGSRVTSLLDLAIDFNNIEFVVCAIALRPFPLPSRAPHQLS